jgi:hypothetical protein
MHSRLNMRPEKSSERPLCIGTLHPPATRFENEINLRLDIHCPFCGKIHRHGWNPSCRPRVPQERGSHCATGEAREGSGRYLVRPATMLEDEYAQYEYCPLFRCANSA